MSTEITTIVLPTRPQPDTVVAIFLLQALGADMFPGIKTATVSIDPTATASPEKFLLDVGGGEFDHHNTDLCATEIIAKRLGIFENPELRNLLAYARRDDTQGKGTVSKDPIDRAFGLSGLIASLNKQNPTNPQYVVDTALPLVAAHYHTACQQFVELPKLVASLNEQGAFFCHILHKPFRNLKVAATTSDHIGLAGYLRAATGGNYNIIIQRRSTNHVNVFTKPNPKIDLSHTMALLRLREANLRGVVVTDEQSLYTTGTHPLVPNWYYDPATNSLLNGGTTPQAVEPTCIPWNELVTIFLHGIQNK